jgi:hypothetical protein
MKKIRRNIVLCIVQFSAGNFLISCAESSSIAHVCLDCRNLEIVNFLITNGADVNLKCFGSPPTFLALYAAAQPESYSFGFECFKLLIAHSDANPFAKVSHTLYVFNYLLTLLEQIRTTME